MTVPDQKGRSLFVGRDGHWTRIKQAATPFKSEAAATALADDLNDKRRHDWE